MNRTLFFSRCYFILTGIAVLSIPFTPLLYFFITPLLLTLWGIEGDWKNKWKRLKESRLLIITSAFALFWLFNIIGLFYSNDMVRGFMRTYDKLPFIVYPIVFFTINKTCFSKTKLHVLFKGFIGATTIMLLICWGRAFMQYFSTGLVEHFYYIRFSHFFGHPAYCALIICIAFCALFYFFNPIAKSYRWIWFGLMFFFAVSIYFLQSKSGILSFFLILTVTVFYYLNKHKKSFWQGSIGIIIILIFLITIIQLFPYRVGEYVEKMNTEQLQAKNILGPRSEIWNTSYRLAMKHFISGIGTGYQVDSFLTEEDMERFNFDHLFINAHNQFLQTFLDHGIFALALLVFLMGYSFCFAINTKDYLLIILMTGVIINMFFESMLERSHGIFTFTLFYCLFIVKNPIFATENLEKA